MKQCVGCSACAAICPREIISMCQDAEGFLIPNIDITQCDSCNRCHDVCPVEKTEGGLLSLVSFASWNLNEDVRSKSSSGGVFTALANNVIKNGGVVVGAAFCDNLVVRHIIVEDNVERLRGSKYVQSEIPIDIYHKMYKLLERNISVLFSGTPCQVAAVRSFLGERDNLFCCDVACHGVPSPLLFSQYSGNELNGMSFRDKTTGWKNYSIYKHFKNGRIEIKLASSDPYMIAFLRDYALRHSCYDCKFKGEYRKGDLTLADFWGAETKYDRDDKGTSLVIVNTEKGKVLLERCREDLFIEEVDMNGAIKSNTMLTKSCARPIERDTFYKDLVAISFSDLIQKYHLFPPQTLLGRIRKWVDNI